MKFNEIKQKLKTIGKWYFAYGFLFSILFQITLLLFINVLLLPLYFFKRHIYQWIFQRITEVYMLHFAYIFHYIMGNRVIESGDELIPNENALLIVNSTHLTDFLPIVLQSPRCGRIGAMRFFMSEEISKIPLVGFGFYMMDSIYLKRNFRDDKPFILNTFKRFRNKYYPFWLTYFPEGKTCTPKRLKESQEYCKQRNIPHFNHLLHPRPSPFIVTIQQLRNVIPYVYDVTLGYPQPSSLACIFFPGEGVPIHMNIKRIDVSTIPEEDDELIDWLNALWVEKDQKLAYFAEHKHFDVSHEHVAPLTFTWANFDGYMSPDCFSKP